MAFCTAGDIVCFVWNIFSASIGFIVVVVLVVLVVVVVLFLVVVMGFLVVVMALAVVVLVVDVSAAALSDAVAACRFMFGRARIVMLNIISHSTRRN